MMEKIDGDHNVVVVGVMECLPWKWKTWKERVRNSVSTISRGKTFGN